MLTLAVLTTAQSHDQGPSTTTLLLLLIIIIILIVAGKALTKDMGSLAVLAAAAVSSIFANLRAIILMLLAVLLALALTYSNKEERGTRAPPDPAPTSKAHTATLAQHVACHRSDPT